MIRKLALALAALALTAGGVAAYGSINNDIDAHPPTSPLSTPQAPGSDHTGPPSGGQLDGELPPGEGGQMGGEQGGGRPHVDLAAVAEQLGVSEDELRAALGDPRDGPPDLEAAAQQLGISRSALYKKLRKDHYLDESASSG